MLIIWAYNLKQFVIVFSIIFLNCFLFSALQMPSIHILQYTAQVLGVILALLDDPNESVQLTAVSCLLMVKTPSPVHAH